MTAMHNPYQAYRKNQVETATREELLLMLYRGALGFLDKAKKAIGEQDISGSHHNLIRSQKIIAELMSSVDLENGGEVARNLFNLYEYMHRQLVQANIDKDTAPVEEVENMLYSLLEAWQEALNTGEDVEPQQDQEQETAATSGGAGSESRHG